MRSLNILYSALLIGVVVLLLGIFLLTVGQRFAGYAGLIIGLILLSAGITALVIVRGAGRPRT